MCDRRFRILYLMWRARLQMATVKSLMMDYHADAFSAEGMSCEDVEKVKERIRSLQSKSWRDWTEDDLAWAQAFRAQYQSFTGPKPRHGGAAATEPQPSLRRLVGALKRGISAVHLTRQRKQNVHFSEQAEIDGAELVLVLKAVAK